MDHKKEVNKGPYLSEKILLDGEKIIYNHCSIIITNKRLIKHNTGKLSTFTEFFSEDYQDMDIKKIVSVKIEEQVHMGLVKIGLAVLLFIPLLLVLSQIDYVVEKIPYFSYPAAKISSILLLISLIFFVSSIASKKKVLSVFGDGGAKIDFYHYCHDDMLQIRKHQFSAKV